MKEEESLRSNNLSIISHRARISSSCFVCITPIASSTADVITLAIDCSTVGSMSAVERL